MWRPLRPLEGENWELFDTDPAPGTSGVRPEAFVRGRTQYELSNHLGNVLVTISDNRIPVDNGTYTVMTVCPSCLPGYPCIPCYNHYEKESDTEDGIVDHYTARVLTANDYYPFGMVMPGRKFTASDLYRYGFNGKENDNDVKGEGNQQDYGMRIYDPRLGRFLSVDPLADSYPWFSSYQFTGNNPILLIDLDGQEGSWVNPQTGEIVPSGPILLPTGSRNQNGWVLYGGLSRPTSFKRADDFKPIAPSLTPMLQQGSDNLASVKANQSKLVVAPKKKESIETRNVQYLSADRRTDYEKQLSAQTKAQYEHAQHIGRMMQTPEGQGGMALGLFMKSTAETPISIGQNGYGVYTGLRDGDYGKAAAHTALLGLDLAPFLPFVAKGGIAAKTGTSVLSAGDALRIENAATRIGKPITVVGSRAKGTAGAFSDWDYVIEGLNNKGWKQIKNSLPGSKSVLDNTPRNIDVFKTLDPTKPHITIYPR